MGCVLCCTCSSCCAESYQTNDIHTPFTNRTHVSVPSESNKLSFNITNSSSSPHNETDNCFTFTPLVKLKKTRNGVVALQITNLLQIMNASNKYNDWNEWHFQFCYKFIHHNQQEETKTNEWKCITFTPDKVTQKGMFYIKIKLYLYDYQIHCKLRAKHTTFDYYFPYSSVIKVNILSSLIESTFNVGEYINFLDENSMYTKEGFVEKILPENQMQIKCKNNDRKLITIHNNRVYAAPIYLGFVIDLTDGINVDKNMLLRNKINDDNDIVSVFITMNDIYKEYALELCIEHQSEPLRECDAVFIGRFISKHVIDFLYKPYYKEPKIGCLVQDSDGWISIKPYVHHCLNRHRQGIENNTSDVMAANLQDLWSYCDICSIEISRYDWITSCNVEIHNSHVMCLYCVNNKIEQTEQLFELLNQLLKQYMYNDCIQQLVEFVVGRVVAHEQI
eukprot:341860_1